MKHTPAGNCHILIVTVSVGGFFYEKSHDLSQEKNLAGLSHMCSHDAGNDRQAGLSDGVPVRLLLPESTGQLHERERDIKAARGQILDAQGRVLADNKTVCTISVIHSQIKEPEKVIQILSKELDMDTGNRAKKSGKGIFY